MLTALTRIVSRSILNCELTHLERQPIDLNRARDQHEAYAALLRSLGVEVIYLPEEANLPDSVFVEDAAIVLDECALITRPGAASRRPETESIAQALEPYRPLLYIRAPGTLDGGDVLTLGKILYVGLSSRSNQAAAIQMRTLLAPFGYSVNVVSLSGCLHLKSAVTALAEDALLVNPEWVDGSLFPGYRIIEVDPEEPSAANVLLVAGRVISQPCFPATIARLQAEGFQPLLVDESELGKAEGALTCCSLIFNKISMHLPV